MPENSIGARTLADAFTVEYEKGHSLLFQHDDGTYKPKRALKCCVNGPLSAGHQYLPYLSPGICLEVSSSLSKNRCSHGTILLICFSSIQAIYARALHTHKNLDYIFSTNAPRTRNTTYRTSPSASATTDRCYVGSIRF